MFSFSFVYSAIGIPIKFVCGECDISTFYNQDIETQEAMVEIKDLSIGWEHSKKCFDLKSLITVYLLFLFVSKFSFRPCPVFNLLIKIIKH